MYLEHVNMTVRNLEESLAFYCELLDGEVSWRGTAMNMKGTVPAAHMRLDRGYIAATTRLRPVECPLDV
jgi:catechol 2,3-dioxygenase-like lactoylglutathione lyase family enzyme